MSVEEGKKFAEDRNLFFIEASAVDTTNVDTVFVRLIEEITNTVSLDIAIDVEFQAQ